MQLQPQDLQESGYHWEENGNELFQGEPTRRLFNRYSGDQVLFILNCYQNLSPTSTIEDLRHLELRLHNSLPLNPMSEISVLNWLQQTEKEPQH